MKHNRIAIVNQWPDVPNAEKENVSRIKHSAQALGVEVLVIDRDGYIQKTETMVTHNDVDFVINMHFETPKTYDAYSYVTLWNPVHFYFDWGYESHSNNLATHDDFLTSESEWAEDHLKRILYWNKKRLPAEIKLHPSISTPIIKPTSKKNKKIFYCGINWDKLNNKKSRHADVLKALDDNDSIRIYGPEKLQGVKIWGEFKNYVKPIPFDGISLIHEISACGIGLVFSSDAHNINGIMSNRLYECLAAGAVIICDENSFAKKYFSDCFLFVNSNQPQERFINDIKAQFEWINANPEKATALAEKAQNVFIEMLCLEKELKELFDNHDLRKAKLESIAHASTEKFVVNYIHIEANPSSENTQKLINTIQNQTYKNIITYLIIDTKTPDSIKKCIEEKAYACNRPIEVVYLDFMGKSNNQLLSTGKIAAQISGNFENDDLIMISTDHSRLLSDHITTLVRLFEDDSNLMIAASDAIFASVKDKQVKPYLQVSRTVESFLYFSHESCFQVLLFKKKSLSKDLSVFFDYLDGVLIYFLTAVYKQQTTFTGRSTFINYFDAPKIAMLPVLPVEDQIQLVRPIAPTENLNMSATFIIDKINNASPTEKSTLSKVILKNIPINKKIKDIAFYIYRTFVKP